MGISWLGSQGGSHLLCTLIVSRVAILHAISFLIQIVALVPIQSKPGCRSSTCFWPLVRPDVAQIEKSTNLNHATTRGSSVCAKERAARQGNGAVDVATIRSRWLRRLRFFIVHDCSTRSESSYGSGALRGIQGRTFSLGCSNLTLL